MDDSITVVAVGTTITTGATSTSTTIPTAQSGETPRYIRVSADTACFVKLGTAAATATANDILVQPGDAVILHVPGGYTKIAAIQSAAAGKCNVVPLENM
jgi:aspartate/methionine/tyrosine aminotransferase